MQLVYSLALIRTSRVVLVWRPAEERRYLLAGGFDFMAVLIAHCTSSIVPSRDRGPWRGHEGPVPDAPVQQGGAVRLLPPGGQLDLARETPRERRGDLPCPRDPVPRRERLHRRHRNGRGEEVRHRGLVSTAAGVPRSNQLQQLHGLTGPATEHPGGQGRRREVCPPHAERDRDGDLPRVGGRPGELPERGRERDRSEGVASAPGRAGRNPRAPTPMTRL